MGHRDAITLTTDEAVKSVQQWMTLDLWMALGLHLKDFAEKYEEDGFATTWADLCQMVRDVDGFSRAAAITPVLDDGYQQCPNCKAVLPAGQTCDCRDRLNAALREAEERQ